MFSNYICEHTVGTTKPLRPSQCSSFSSGRGGGLLCCTKRRAENMLRAKIQIRKRLTMLRMSERRSNGLDLAQNSFWRRRILPGRTPTYEKDDLCECLAVQMNSKLGYAYARHHERMLCSAPNQGCARNTCVSPAKRMAAEASTGNMTNFWCFRR